jgi:hypothetical protein
MRTKATRAASVALGALTWAAAALAEVISEALNLSIALAAASTWLRDLELPDPAAWA